MDRRDLVAVKNGKYRIWWDEDRGSVSVDLEGFWSSEDVRDFVDPLETAIARSRDRHGSALLLFDATKNEVMPLSLIDRVKADSEKVSGLNDRVAIVVLSSLLKMQMKRFSAENSNSQFFLSQEAAATWLYAKA